MFAKNQKLFFGLSVILFGIILLLDNLKLFNLRAEFWWGIAFIVLGAIFRGTYRQNKTRKGTLVAGLIFLFLGLILILDSFAFIPSDVIGTLIFWGIGGFFISIFVKNSDRWWGIIPGGVFLVLGFLVLIDAINILDNDLFGFIFMFGISLLFWFLYLIKDEKNKLHWAGMVAMLLTIFSFFVLKNEMDTSLTNILFPVSIIGGGVFLIFRGINLENKPVQR